MKPVRVLHLIASNFVGGPEKQILRHVAEDSTARLELWVGSFRDAGEKPEILRKADNLHIPTIEFSAGRIVPLAVCELLKALRHHDISVLCTHGYKANVLGYLASKFTGRPHIAFFRGSTGENFRVRVYDTLERLALQRACCVACVSRSQAEQLASKRGRRILPAYIANAVMPAADAQNAGQKFLRREYGLPEDAFVVVAAGRLSPEKGHRFLLEACSQLRKQIPELAVVILGEGAERGNLEAQRQALGLSDCVSLPGFRHDVQRWMRAADAVVNPSLTEGMPNVVLEAMALGVPVVATAVGSLPDMMTSGSSGLMIAPGNSRDLSQAVAFLHASAERAKMIGQQGKKAVEQFSPQNQARNLRQAYIDALNLPANALDEPGTPAQTPLPSISVVVPVRNEEAYLDAVLGDLIRQEYATGHFEIIVVDGNSTDHTRQIVATRSTSTDVPVRLVHNPELWSSAGRNQGVLHSHGEIVIFVDGHCRVNNPRLLAEVARAVREEGAECLSRPQPLAGDGNSWFQDVVAHVRATAIAHGAGSTIYGEVRGFVDPVSAGFGYRREVFDHIGLYDESFDACEDVELNYRVREAGLRAYSSPEMAVHYSPRQTLRGLFQQLMRYGRGRVRLMRKHPGAATASQFVPAALVGWMVAGALLGTFEFYFRAAYAITMWLYFALIAAYSLQLGIRYGWRHLFTAPFVFFAVHLGLGCGFWAEALAFPDARRVARTPEIEAVRSATKEANHKSSVEIT